MFKRKNLFVVLLLGIFTVFLNSFIFSKQLNYGFRDVDWQVLYYFKIFGNLSLNHLLREIQALGVYAFESYYVGFLVDIIGINFSQLHQATHIFKIISAVFVYILILKLFKNKLLAFITSLLYSISYTHAGVLFQLASGGYFITIIFMALLLIFYSRALFEKNIVKWGIISSVFLAVTLLLKPERMYPLILLIIFVELVKIIKEKFRRKVVVDFFKRALIILLPVIIFSFLSRILFNSGNLHFGPDQFSYSANMRFESIKNGNLHLLIYPFASFGSIFLYGDYWKLLGQLNFQDISTYIPSLIFGPTLKLGVLTLILLSLIYKKPFKQTLIIVVLIITSGLVIYALKINWEHINQEKRMHFDPNLVAMPAIFGFYILSIGGLLALKLIKDKYTKLLPLVAGLFFAFLFVVLTWIPSDLQLVFMGPQRYLSIPSIGTSLFIAGVFVLIFDRLRKIKFAKNFSWMIFLLLLFLIAVNYRVAYDFFDYELKYAGLQGSEQTRMKNKFRQLTGKLSTTEKSLFYFDETADKINGYFDEGTVIAGFESWIRVNMDGTLNHFPEPGMMRTNIQCPEHTHNNCVSILKAGLGVKNSQEGIWYKDPIRGNKNIFYKLDNFYAVRFINKDIVDIRKEVLKEIGKASVN